MLLKRMNKSDPLSLLELTRSEKSKKYAQFLEIGKDCLFFGNILKVAHIGNYLDTMVKVPRESKHRDWRQYGSM